ncbi:alpha-galactosidase [Paenibacillus mendelii]|uniref:Alpha-galactosidase n=1 Tax=Paenibacillus mendelii TaxID=206163 RepID=A0ABV6JE82_9BACL|nr:alpha-galactosidase [Paenibacillus mendelii]MCQ6563341.1 alpha-galactosidase [Paenibacillus mendelii]
MAKVKAAHQENVRAQQVYAKLLTELADFPISFKLAGKSYKGFNDEFAVSVNRKPLEGFKETATVTAAHASGLVVTVHTAFYPQYAAYEWTAWFKNTSSENIGPLADVNGADVLLEGYNPVLRYLLGDGSADGAEAPFKPHVITMTSHMALDFTCTSGRATEGNFPYYNLEHGDGGTLLIVGWPSQWRARFSYTYGNMHFTAGQEKVNAILYPGEQIRAPLMVFIVYDGRDDLRVSNLWRRWYIDCNMRKIDNKMFEPVVSGGTSWIYEEMIKATDENQIAAIKTYAENGIQLDYWWMDAGWYYKRDGETLDVWLPTGYWHVDKHRFPSEFADIADYGATVGTKMLLWFEPEVVRMELDELTEGAVKREWLVGSHREDFGKSGVPEWYLVDFGNAEFRKYFFERTTSIIDKGKIALYRQDYGIYPLPIWEKADSPDRIGMTENLYNQGYLEFWDALIERYPNMMIDSCASGGRRNDLESMRRSVPLHKTDADYSNFAVKHSMHQSLYNWLPYYGTPVTGPNYANPNDKYAIRSAFIPWIAFGFDVRKDNVDWNFVAGLVNEWKQFNHLFYEDYYPLLPWSRSEQDWAGWQFINSDTGEGVVQLFRREENEEAQKTIKLHGLDAKAKYELRDLDRGVTFASGKELMEKGYLAALPEPRSSAVVLIRQV